MPSIKKISTPQLQTLYQTQMQRDFPADELRPLQSMIQLTHQGDYLSFGYLDDRQEMIAYATFALLPERQAALLDYYAVLPAHRGSGIGSAFLGSFQKLLSPYGITHLLIEVEAVETADTAADAALRENRIHFYEKNHCVLSSVCTKLLGVTFRVMSRSFTDQPLPENVIVEEMTQIYQIILRPLLSSEKDLDQLMSVWSSPL